MQSEGRAEHMDRQLALVQAHRLPACFTHCCVAASASLRWGLNDSILVLQLLEGCAGMLQLAPIKEDNGF